MAENNRAHTRYSLPRHVIAVGKEAGVSHDGMLANISAGGAMINLTSPMRHVTHEFEPGMTIDMAIDGFPPLEGDIVRTTENALALSFFPETTDQKELMAAIIAAMDIEADPSATE